MFRLMGLDHLVLRVVDVQRMLHFYVQALGCSVERRQDGIGLIQLRSRARTRGDPSILHGLLDPKAIAPGAMLSGIHSAAIERQRKLAS